MMTAISKEFARTNQHGITGRELNKLVDDIHDFIITNHEAGGLRGVAVTVIVHPRTDTQEKA